MINVRYLPPLTSAEYDKLVLELLRKPRELRPDQHVVSRVLLERFAEPVGAKGERKIRYDGELLISDVPVLALREGSLSTGPLESQGIANCDELVLPLGPELVAVLGSGRGYTTMDAATVRKLNAAQIRASADYVYMRPGSGLEDFVRTSTPNTHPNRIPPHLRQAKVPTTFARIV